MKYFKNLLNRDEQVEPETRAITRKLSRRDRKSNRIRDKRGSNKKLTNNKSAEGSGILTEILKEDGDRLQEKLYRLVLMVQELSSMHEKEDKKLRGS